MNAQKLRVDAVRLDSSSHRLRILSDKVSELGFYGVAAMILLEAGLIEGVSDSILKEVIQTERSGV